MTRGHSVKHGWYEKRLAEKSNAIAASREYDLIFVGDSITQGWDSPWSGKPVLDKLAKEYRILTLGYGGDMTEHVIWRLQNGELDGYRAKMFMLLIGVNNAGNGDRPEQVRDGVKKILSLIREKHPESKILLMGVFPCKEETGEYTRIRTIEIKNKVRPLADEGDDIRWLDIGKQLMRPDRTISPEMMKDFLHPGTRGYEIWAEAAKPYFEWACGRGKAPDNPPIGPDLLECPKFSDWRELTPEEKGRLYTITELEE